MKDGIVNRSYRKPILILSYISDKEWKTLDVREKLICLLAEERLGATGSKNLKRVKNGLIQGRLSDLPKKTLKELKFTPWEGYTEKDKNPDIYQEISLVILDRWTKLTRREKEEVLKEKNFILYEIEEKYKLGLEKVKNKKRRGRKKDSLLISYKRLNCSLMERWHF